jgi:hypothetical protein
MEDLLASAPGQKKGKKPRGSKAARKVGAAAETEMLDLNDGSETRPISGECSAVPLHGKLKI